MHVVTSYSTFLAVHDAYRIVFRISESPPEHASLGRTAYDAYRNILFNFPYMPTIRVSPGARVPGAAHDGYRIATSLLTE